MVFSVREQYILYHLDPLFGSLITSRSTDRCPLSHFLSLVLLLEMFWHSHVLPSTKPYALDGNSKLRLLNLSRWLSIE